MFLDLGVLELLVEEGHICSSQNMIVSDARFEPSNVIYGMPV